MASLMAAVADTDNADTFAPVVLRVRDGPPLQLSVEQIRNLTWKELARIWKVRLRNHVHIAALRRRWQLEPWLVRKSRDRDLEVVEESQKQAGITIDHN